MRSRRQSGGERTRDRRRCSRTRGSGSRRSSRSHRSCGGGSIRPTRSSRCTSNSARSSRTAGTSRTIKPPRSCSGSRSATSKTSEPPTGRRNAAYTAARNAKPRAGWSKGKASRTRSKPSNNSHSSPPNASTATSNPRDTTRLHTQLDKLSLGALRAQDRANLRSQRPRAPATHPQTSDTGEARQLPIPEPHIINTPVQQHTHTASPQPGNVSDRVEFPPITQLTSKPQNPTQHRDKNPATSELTHEREDHFEKPPSLRFACNRHTTAFLKRSFSCPSSQSRRLNPHTHTTSSGPDQDNCPPQYQPAPTNSPATPQRSQNPQQHPNSHQQATTPPPPHNSHRHSLDTAPPPPPHNQPQRSIATRTCIRPPQNRPHTDIRDKTPTQHTHNLRGNNV